MRRAILVGLGLFALVDAVIVLAIGVPSDGPVGAIAEALLWLVLLAALVLAVWRLARGAPGVDYAHPGSDPLVERDPEVSQAAVVLSGTAFADTLAEAVTVARKGGDVDEAVAVVRDPLRTVLVDAMVAGGADRERARRRVDAGEWTDDPVAAAVLSPDVTGPNRPLRDRLAAWLFTDRAVRHRTRRAVSEVAQVAGRELPAIPGQTATRNVPVPRPSTDRLQARSASALTLEPAPDPDALEPMAVNPGGIAGLEHDEADGGAAADDDAAGRDDTTETPEEQGPDAGVDPVWDGNAERGSDGGAER
jgi:hypothetical protein